MVAQLADARRVGSVVGRRYWLLKKNSAGAWIIGGCVVSHWVLDWVTHRSDMPLYPGGPKFGLDDISSFLVRPIDIKRTIDHLIVHPPTGMAIDPHRIGFFGFSRGGYTGLVLAGGVPDFSSLIIPCPEKVLICDQIRKHKISAHASGYEPRIAAYVIADPLNFFPNKLSLQKVKAPIQLWSSERGGMGVRPEDVAAVARDLPIKPDFHRVPGSGHLSFDCPCATDQAKAVPPILICSDPLGFDRTDFHRTFNATVADFFRKNLPE